MRLGGITPSWGVEGLFIIGGLGCGICWCICCGDCCRDSCESCDETDSPADGSVAVLDLSGTEIWSSGLIVGDGLPEEGAGALGVSKVFRLAALISANIWLAISMERPQKSGTKCAHLVWQVISHSGGNMLWWVLRDRYLVQVLPTGTFFGTSWAQRQHVATVAAPVGTNVRDRFESVGNSMVEFLFIRIL